MGAHRRIESLGEVRDLEPGRDAADAPDVRLDDRAGAALEILAEMRRVVERLPYRDRHRGLGGELHVAAQILGGQRLLEPSEIEVAIGMGAAAGLGHREGLVRIHHEGKVVADCLAHGGKAPHVLGDGGLADLDLRAAKSLGARRHGLFHDLRHRMVQPPALGRVHGHAPLRAAGHLPQRLPGAQAAQVPQRGVDRRERDARDGAHGRGMRGEKEILPDRFDLRAVAADEARREMIAQ